MTAKHTPGPWSVDDGGDGEHEIWAPESGSKDAICYVGVSEDLADEKKYAQHAANAALIAAAPDLLAALKAAVERMEAVAKGIPVHNRHNGVSQAVHVAHMAGHLEQHAKLARAAIAKAEGRAV